MLFRAVIVNETQDIGNEIFALLRAIIPVGENDFFIVGDLHQRIYQYQVVLRHRELKHNGDRFN